MSSNVSSGRYRFFSTRFSSSCCMTMYVLYVCPVCMSCAQKHLLAVNFSHCLAYFTISVFHWGTYNHAWQGRTKLNTAHFCPPESFLISGTRSSWPVLFTAFEQELTLINLVSETFLDYTVIWKIFVLNFFTCKIFEFKYFCGLWQPMKIKHKMFVVHQYLCV